MAQLNTTRTRRIPAFPPQGGIAPRPWEPSNTLHTHEGAPAARITPELALRRAVCSCLLWENEFYESGKAIADRIAELVREVAPQVTADLAVDARSAFHLRHVPLLLVRELARVASGTSLVSRTLAAIIQRPDEISEFVALYLSTNGGKRTLSAQIKKGLAAAFNKFDQYQLAKYFSTTGEAAAKVRGRDVMFLTHPKPSAEKVELFRRIANKVTIVEGGADTWEVNLSKGADKKETYTRLLEERKLGYLALLRNLRNMAQAGVDPQLVSQAIVARRGGAHRVLPFRYVAAARACPQFLEPLETALRSAIADLKPLTGTTAVLVDVSGSMDAKLSGKSDLMRVDAAAALAALIPGHTRVGTFSNRTCWFVSEQPRGLGGIDAILRSQPHQRTCLGEAVQSTPVVDRLIVITDEQAHDHVEAPSYVERCYLINVASARNGVGYGDRWVHLDGFSEQVIRFIHEYEQLPA